MLHIFYKSVVEGTICSAAIYWGSNIRASDSKKLNKLIQKAGDSSGAPGADGKKKNAAQGGWYEE